MTVYQKGSDVRKPDHPIDPIFLDRWSPRAMSEEEISDDELMSLFEAARWAPSTSNIQPWSFVYAKRGTPEWQTFFDLLVEFNQMWCKNAAVLICLCAKKTDKEGKPNRNHMSDAGAAWENLALQAAKMNLVCHGMGGYDVAGAREKLNIPEDHEVVHMFAIGKPGEISVLHERMQKSEKPNTDRKKLEEFVFEGKFNG